MAIYSPIQIFYRSYVKWCSESNQLFSKDLARHLDEGLKSLIK